MNDNDNDNGDDHYTNDDDYARQNNECLCL